MRVLIQRVLSAQVRVDEKVVGKIGKGLLLFLGVCREDTREEAQKLSGKVARLRIFEDERGMTNLSLSDCQGEVLVISQFTLCASTKKGNRPSFDGAAPENLGKDLYEVFKKELALQIEQPIQSGIFGAKMEVTLVNDGPFTLFIDSRAPS